MRLWVVALTLQTFLLSIHCGHTLKHRRSMGTQGGLPMSKGGWRPVVGSGGLYYGQFGTPLHSQAYKIPIPVLDLYQSSSRPVAAKDTNKLTSIAQSYRPTTLRTASPAPAAPIAHQPINSYHNPFALQNSPFVNYKFIQNFPAQSMVLRNPYAPYAERNLYSKYPAKVKPNTNIQNAMLQQLSNIQPLQFGQYQSVKPLDLFGKPIETYARPNDGKKTQQSQQSNVETFKPEVFKLDNDAAPQSVKQQVKTAQQHGLVGSPNIGNPYPQYSYQDHFLPPNILGTFGTYGVQSVKARDPVYQFPTTFGPSQQTKPAIFNSFNYPATYKTTPTVFDTTTPRAPTTANQPNFATTYSDLRNTETSQAKVHVPPKIDPNANLKDSFKPSQHDPFSNKIPQNDFNKMFVTTYNPVAPTTLANSYYDYNFPSYQSQQTLLHSNQPNSNLNNKNKINLIHDTITAGNQQSVPTKTRSETVKSSHQPTYEVTEDLELRPGTKSSPASWSVTPAAYDYNQKTTVESEKKQEFVETLGRPGTTFTSDVPEEIAIVTEAEKVLGNSLSYDDQIESQSRPLGEDFEPISMDKLKDYYYKVSTPIYEDYSTPKRTKPTESVKYTSTYKTTTPFDNNNDNYTEQLETLPTLPPTQYFKRPISSDSNDKDKVRKRNKIRRRRPPQANISNNEESSTRRASTTVSTTETTLTTNVEDIYTTKSRIKTTRLTTQPNLTTPTVTTDLTTSALPTISPTMPTLVKKKLTHRRPITTTGARPETTTFSGTQDDLRKDSQIMKITGRPFLPRVTNTVRNDYTHKQDEKDTPTSDTAVNLSDNLQLTVAAEQDFSFHKDVKPIEAKLEPVTNIYKETTTDEESSDYTSTPPSEYTTTDRNQRLRLRNKLNRNSFNVKDYRNRLSSTTTSTDKPSENTPKVRLPIRRAPYFDIETETTTERKKFTPKEPRYKIGNNTQNNGHTEKNVHSYKPSRQRLTTTDYTEATTVKVSARVRNGQRRPRPPEETTETSSPTTVSNSKRPLRKRIQEPEVGESVQDVTITEYIGNEKNDLTSERTRSESAIMKIADKKHQDHMEHLFEHSKRVSDLTLAASKDYSKPGMFKTVSSNSRRIPNYFTIATDDPILPIEAFFPQLNQRKDS